jgi:hypothetical protein
MRCKLRAAWIVILLCACAQKPADVSVGPGTGPVSRPATAPVPEMTPDPATVPKPGAGFHQDLQLLGVRFAVDAVSDGASSALTILPSGLSIDNGAITRVVDGTIVGAEVGDVNGDGSPELYVFVEAAGVGKHGQLVAYSANNRKSLSEIAIPDLADDAINSVGYLGRDRFAVVEDGLERRFLIHAEGSSSEVPSGKTRILHYSLVPGEATWQLKLDRVSES